MDGLTAAAAAGLQARIDALDMLANNIANASTTGFKKDGEFYNLYMDAEARAANGDVMPAMPVVEKPWTDFSQGTLTPTGRPRDLALSGKGFFAVNGPSGTLYTRNGLFQIDPTGRVTTGEGYGVRLDDGNVLQVQPDAQIEISADGTVLQEGAVLGRLAIADLPNDQLVKQGSSYFVAAGNATPDRSSARVHQGKLESANVNSAESAVRLVSLMRHFEMLQKAIGIGSEMNRKAVDELARTGS
jgi:flagellar basal body rod protein FlgG